MPINGIAWDDQVGEDCSYIESLREKLSIQHRIDLKTCKEQAEFLREIETGRYQFAILDLVDNRTQTSKNPSRDQEDAGLRLLRKIPNDLPTYFVTGHPSRINVHEKHIPDDVIIKSKAAYAEYVAWDIYQDLVRRGVYIEDHRVFLIWGRDRQAPGLRDKVESELKGNGMTVEMINSATVQHAIQDGLLKKMNRCVAFVALCTPDDCIAAQQLEYSVYAPRPNVLFEMGMVLGLNRGFERLIVLQQWKDGDDYDPKLLPFRATLPSNMGGVVTIRFDGNVEPVLPKLWDRLRELGADLARP